MLRIPRLALFVFVGLGVLPGLSTLVSAQQTERIVAVVNDRAISTSDVRERAILSLIGAGVPVNDESITEIIDQTTRTLIEEQLRIQEALRTGASVPESRIDEAVSNVAAGNGISVEQLSGTFEANGISIGALRDQIYAAAMWNGVRNIVLVGQIDVTEADITARRQELEDSQGKPEYLLAEIFLRIDTPDDEARLTAFAQSLIDEVRGGARFSGIARQFSDGADAASGGDMGWVLEADLEPEIADAVRGMVAGSISGAVRSPFGLHILLLRDQRAATLGDASEQELDFLQLTLGYPQFRSQEEADGWFSGLQSELGTSRSCADFRAIGSARNGEVTEAFGAAIADMPPSTVVAVSQLPENRSSQLFPGETSLNVFMVCARRLPEGSILDDETIEDDIIEERVALLERRLLRDLRAAAFIDIRQ